MNGLQKSWRPHGNCGGGSQDHSRGRVRDSGYGDAAGQNSSYAPIPAVLDRRVVDTLKERHPGGLYSHQSLALELTAGGADICLATSTASGKSLVFQTAALDLLLRDRFAKVVALYPAKALIQDQIEKWRSVLDPFGIRFGFIDGTVPIDHRAGILSSSRVVLMTPDVMHSWLMGRVGERTIRDFLRGLRLLILDEAHVYDGVFGTNMAYFLRRLEAVAAPHRLIVSTATIGDPGQFVARLTGRSVAVVAADLDGSASPQKTVFRIKPSGTEGFESLVALVVALSNLDASRFVAFGDSRKMIERVVAATLRARKPTTETENGERDDEDPDPDVTEALVRILPYRAGYEPCDRQEIQRALSDGTLSGVVSTSALEMGLDIGEIDTVVMLSAPQDIKSFWQRLGRAGRRRDAVCLVVDGEGTMGSLDEYLTRPVEPSWLYLENRYIQYANALCAAAELSAVGKSPGAEPAFATLPSSFVPFVENELNPVDVVPNDLYPLKQRAQAGPHREFYLRSATEQEFKVGDARSAPLGRLSFSQALREAYPGAVHYYMARPYRVFGFNYRTGEIKVKRCRQWTTRPQAQSVVFPRFQGGVLNLLRSDDGMVAEVELQVSERVVGFVEQRGKVKSEHLYGPGSEYYQTDHAVLRDDRRLLVFPGAVRSVRGDGRSSARSLLRRVRHSEARPRRRRLSDDVESTRTRSDGWNLHLRRDERQPAADADARGALRSGRRPRYRLRGGAAGSARNADGTASARRPSGQPPAGRCPRRHRAPAPGHRVAHGRRGRPASGPSTAAPTGLSR